MGTEDKIVFHGPRWLYGFWLSTRPRIPLLGFALVSALIELFYFDFMISRGMLDKQVQLQLGGWLIPLSISLALALGNAVLLVSLWQGLFERIAYAGLSSDRRVRRIMYLLRMIRTSALILAPFTILLFLPYILESTWWVGLANGVGNSVPSLRGSIDGFYSWSYGLSRTDAPTKFIASQLIASFGTIVVAGLQLWRVQSAKGLTKIVQRRRLR